MLIHGHRARITIKHTHKQDFDLGSVLALTSTNIPLEITCVT